MCAGWKPSGEWSPCFQAFKARSLVVAPSFLQANCSMALLWAHCLLLLHQVFLSQGTYDCTEVILGSPGSILYLKVLRVVDLPS